MLTLDAVRKITSSTQPRAALFSLAVALFLASAHTTGYAHQPSPLDIGTLTRRAAVVLEARVADVQSSWNASGTQILTRVRMDVLEYHKGDLGQRSLEITQLGGTVGDITFVVLGQPSFAVDEQTFLFLAPNYGLGQFPLVEGEQGKFTVTADPVTQTEVLRGVAATVSKTSAVSTVRGIVAAASTAAGRP